MNGLNVEVKLTRGELIRVCQACTALKWDFINGEIKDESSAKMWGELHDKLWKQLEEFDAKHGVE